MDAIMKVILTGLIAQYFMAFTLGHQELHFRKQSRIACDSVETVPGINDHDSCPANCIGQLNKTCNGFAFIEDSCKICLVCVNSSNPTTINGTENIYSSFNPRFILNHKKGKPFSNI